MLQFVAIAAPYQALEVVGFYHLFVVLFYVYVVILLTDWPVLRLELDAEDANWIRVVTVVSNFLTLHTELYFV